MVKEQLETNTPRFINADECRELLKKTAEKIRISDQTRRGDEPGPSQRKKTEVIRI